MHQISPEFSLTDLGSSQKCKIKYCAASFESCNVRTTTARGIVVPNLNVCLSIHVGPWKQYFDKKNLNLIPNLRLET